MLTDEAVPRLKGGGIALCHLCQRGVYFANGFMPLLLKKVEMAAKTSFVRGSCPRCGHLKLYHISRGERLRCAACKYDFRPTVGTERHSQKKPSDWYEKIISLLGKGLTPHAISIEMGMDDSKSVYAFVGRMNVVQRLRYAARQERGAE